MPAIPSSLNPHSAQSSISSINPFDLSVANTVGGQSYCVANGASFINPLDDSTLTCPTIPAMVDKATRDLSPPLTISIRPGDRGVLRRDEDSHQTHDDVASTESIGFQGQQERQEEESPDAENAASPLRLSFLPSQLEQVTELLLKHGIDFRFVNDTTQEQREDSGSKSWGSIALMTMPLFLLIGFASGRKWEQSCKTISFEDFETLKIQGSKGLTAQFLSLPQALREFIQEDCGHSPYDLGNFRGQGRRLGERRNGGWGPYGSYFELDSIV
jgi:hypothetical protein